MTEGDFELLEKYGILKEMRDLEDLTILDQSSRGRYLFSKNNDNIYNNPIKYLINLKFSYEKELRLKKERIASLEEELEKLKNS